MLPGGRSAGPPPALRAAIARHYGVELIPGSATVVHAGDEAAVWRARTARGPIVVRLGPAWRTPAEVAWVHELLAYAAGRVAEAVAPLAAPDGSTALWWHGRPVALFPLVAGLVLDRDDARLRAGRPGCWRGCTASCAGGRRRGRGPRRARTPHPGGRATRPAGGGRPRAGRLAPGVVGVDRADGRGPAVARRLLPPYLLCRGGRIVGVVDWDDAHLGAPVEEAAWAAWSSASWTTGRASTPRGRGPSSTPTLPAVGPSPPAPAGTPCA